jgi:hypothetical protein
MTTLEETPLENLEEKVFATMVELLHSTQLERIEYNHVSAEVEDVVEIYIGEPSEKDGHVLVSTFGAGSLVTKGNASIDGVEKPYRAEFYGVAKDVAGAKLLAERLAKLAFIVSGHEEAFVPGMVVTGLGIEGNLSHTLISENPIGVLNGHGAIPIVTSEFSIFWVAVNPISEEEALAFSSTETGLNDFLASASDQGLDFYDDTRNVNDKNN